MIRESDRAVFENEESIAHLERVSAAEDGR